MKEIVKNLFFSEALDFCVSPRPILRVPKRDMVCIGRTQAGMWPARRYSGDLGQNFRQIRIEHGRIGFVTDFYGQNWSER